MRRHTKFGLKISEIDLVIEIKCYLTFWSLPRAPGGGPKKCEIANPVYVTNSHTKFAWIYCNGLGGDSMMDGRTDALTVGYFLGTYSVRKSSQESINTQQFPGIFYGINLILS